MPGAHALLSPSGASRWLACTPSARLEEHLEDKSNDSADEGTLAHSLCEIFVKKHFGLMSSALFKSELALIKKHRFYNKDMEGHCLEFLNHLIEKVEDRDDPIILVEEKVDISEFVPGGFGTVDSGLICGEWLDITDFKYGKGIYVEAVENKQMKLYALGMIKKYVIAYGFKKVRMTIFQPRLSNYSSFEMTVKELLAWGEKEVKPKAKQAFEGTGDFVPGDHCKFCKVRYTCKALANYQMEIAQDAFPDPNKLSDKETADILKRASTFISWINDITGYALAEAIKGKKWPGFKLVEGRSNRKIIDEMAIIKALQKAKVEQDNYMSEPSLLTLTKLEQNLGSEKFMKLCGKWIEKPKGSPALVDETDKRPALNNAESAKKAFENI